jgi:hypothetical protein
MARANPVPDLELRLCGAAIVELDSFAGPLAAFDWLVAAIRSRQPRSGRDTDWLRPTQIPELQNLRWRSWLAHRNRGLSSGSEERPTTPRDPVVRGAQPVETRSQQAMDSEMPIPP